MTFANNLNPYEALQTMGSHWVSQLFDTQINSYTAKHDYSAICKQLGSMGDAEYLGVSPRSKLFDTETTISRTLGNIEAL